MFCFIYLLHEPVFLIADGHIVSTVRELSPKRGLQSEVFQLYSNPNRLENATPNLSSSSPPYSLSPLLLQNFSEPGYYSPVLMFLLNFF